LGQKIQRFSKHQGAYVLPKEKLLLLLYLEFHIRLVRLFLKIFYLQPSLVEKLLKLHQQLLLYMEDFLNL
jgi:hypothetical protein